MPVFAPIFMLIGASFTAIDDKIISLLQDTHTPVSTRGISMKIQLAWYTVNLHCLKLHTDGKINMLKAGNITLWSINNE